MAETTIEWCRPYRADGSQIEGYTGNLWWGCEEVHLGCDNCYARTFAHRYETIPIWGMDTPRKAVKSIWRNLELWQQAAAALDEQHCVFVGSMMDIMEKPHIVTSWAGEPLYFRNRVMTTEDLRNRFTYEVVPVSPNLVFLLLSKRSSLYNRTVPVEWLIHPPSNVWFGTSASDQATYDIHKRQLLRVNGKRFLSLEPLVGPIETGSLKGIDWVIVGGESGGKKRPVVLDWFRRIRDQCQAQNVPFFMKQVDKVQPIPDDLLIREFPTF